MFVTVALTSRRLAPSYFPAFALLLLLYPVELFDYIILNVSDPSYTYGLYGVNTLLLNVLNRYHPLVFYASVGLLLASVLLSSTSLGSRYNAFALTNSFLTMPRYHWFAIFTNLTAL